MQKIRRTAALAACFFFALALQGGVDFDAARYLDEVKYLASPEMRGRGDGSPELEKAGDYIARQFRGIGLKPVDSGNYLQAFQVTTNAKLGPKNSVEITDANGKKQLKAEEDFIPFNFSESGTLTAPVVFAGYGITAPEYGYDDYANIDVKGKFVLVLRHEPQEEDENSVFAGRMLTQHAQFWSKAVNAKAHGAKGVILVNDLPNHGGVDDLERFGRTAGPDNAGIVFVQVKAATAEEWLKEGGKSIEQVEAAIDHDLHTPQSFPLPDALRVTITADVEREMKTVHNVAGFLPGKTPEYIVIGAHYDHIGLGEQFSMAPSMAGTPHLGADDNASGTAGIIELARWFASKPKPKRGILFLAFAGEELGLLGSGWYVNHPDLPMGEAVAMVNLDMIGRVRDGKIYVGGTGTGSTFKALVEKAVPKYHLAADYSGAADSGSSDHSSFTSKQVPALFFFSGLHADYHKPSDTWDKINAPGAVEVLRAVADVAQDIIQEPGRPQFIKPPAPPRQAGGGGQGYGPYFGSIPDFGETAKGVKFADVREGSPARKAGLQAGDVLVEFDGKPVENLYDFTYALRGKKPGDAVKVKVLRGGQPVEANVTLEERK